MSGFCCKMRQKFLIGIIAENPSVPMPIDAADCIDFSAEGPIHPETGKLRPVIRIRFCPFCGAAVKGPLRGEPDAGR